MPNHLSSSPDFGILRPTPHTPLSFQPESQDITSQLTTFSPLPHISSVNPNKLQSTSAQETQEQKVPLEWYGKPYL